MTKTLVGTAVGALALGSLVTAQALKAPSADAAGHKTFESRSDAATPVLVNCADGYRALVRPVAIAGQQASQVDCVATGTLPVTVDAWGQPVTYAQAQPTFASYGAAPRPAVQTQTVYRPATTTRTAARPATRTVARQPTTQTRSWKKSALIIGGSAAGGAAVGAVLDGKSGAKKGAIVGGVAGTVYDIATRSKTQY